MPGINWKASTATATGVRGNLGTVATPNAVKYRTGPFNRVTSCVDITVGDHQCKPDCAKSPAVTAASAAAASENLTVTKHVVVLSRDGVLTQLKEITGVEDQEILKQALEASRNESGTYDISHAVNILVDENAVQYNRTRDVVPKAATSMPKWSKTTKHEPETVTEGADVRVIDLTSDNSEKDELQKAIALSLQEQQHGMLGGQVSAEEQDISVVLEQSLAESKVGTKRKRGEVWQDPLNPHDRKRTDCCPVGLKNVGNTCWFSAVIQSLFHLPVFRYLVLNFVPRVQWDVKNLAANSPAKRNLLFMQELRTLFALMVGTRRKYVDPSKAVDILKEAFQSGSTDSQQDVSEFTHKLLEWLEDAFKSDSTSRPSTPLSELALEEQGNEEQTPSETKHNRNPMLDLFYGQFRSEGLNNGHVFSNEETFGQYPLQINGFGNIHESLEAATAQEIETYNVETMVKSGQEHWFTQLPPILLFELSRFQFNQHFGRPEKIHNKFDFPEVVYMDRYMEVNKNITRVKREEIRKLKERRDELQNRLEKFLNFGSGSKRFPLQDVLQYTLEFVENKQESSSQLPTDVEMSLPNSDSSAPVDSVNRLSTKPQPSTNRFIGPASLSSAPAPKHVSELELHTLQSCLRRWRTEVENDVKGLQDLISSIDCTIGAMYNEPSLQKVPYQLHAVLVHEGQAASGHYWAYVYDHSASNWLKFNDITVTEATWDELQKESAGGHHNASAYCLMYIDSMRKELIKNCVDEEAGQKINSVDSLLPDLQNLVFEDNLRFQKEIEAWDVLEQTLSDKENAQTWTEQTKYERAESSTAMQAPTIVPEPVNIGRFVLTSTPSQWFNHMEEIFRKEGATATNKVVQMTLDYFRQLASICDPVQDARIQDLLVYIMANAADEIVVIWITLEILTQLNTDQRDVLEQKLKQFVSQKVQPRHREIRDQWEKDFKEFRRVTALFVVGIECFHDGRFSEALPYLMNALALNENLVCGGRQNSGGCHRGLDSKLLDHCRCQCLLKLNEEASHRFDSKDVDEAGEAVDLMNDFVVPCMNLLTSSDTSSKEGNMTAELIRGTWCSKLGDETQCAKSELLQDFLIKLLDPSADVKLRDNVALLRSAEQLSQDRYEAAMKLAINLCDSS